MAKWGTVVLGLALARPAAAEGPWGEEALRQARIEVLRSELREERARLAGDPAPADLEEDALGRALAAAERPTPRPGADEDAALVARCEERLERARERVRGAEGVMQRAVGARAALVSGASSLEPTPAGPVAPEVAVVEPGRTVLADPSAGAGRVVALERALEALLGPGDEAASTTGDGVEAPAP